MVRAPDVTVRRAVPDDAEGIVALLDAVAREGTLGVPASPRRPVAERALLAGTAGIACASWVAEAEGRIGGHLLAVRGPAPYLRHVADVAVAVAPHLRQRGTGGRLLDCALAWGREQGLAKISASVLAGNAPALALFASRGFVEEGRRRGQLRIEGVTRDEVLLARFLG
jgi:RimJ/RimL family protein N-acetyltransferase